MPAEPTPHPETRAANDVRPVRDLRIARALDAIAERPRDRWTVAKLAKVAGLSRAAFARRFAEEVASPPLRHVAAVRIARAAELLAAPDATLADVADVVGYANEFALSRAFRRHMGEPPGVFRRRIQSANRTLAPRCQAA